jgi:hypothetical protein
MKLYISEEVMHIFRFEMEKFGMQKICLTPVWVEGKEPKVWAMCEAGTISEPIVELKSSEMSIWVPQKCLVELDEQLIVRGGKGFTIGSMTDSLLSRATPFE